MGNAGAVDWGEATDLVFVLSRLFSRVEPAHKSKIVGYLQDDGAVSAMVQEYV